MISPRWVKILALLIGAFLLSSIAFFNGYPLLTSDTGVYISSGFRWSLPKDRPIFYGIFLRQISLAHSLWFVVIAQGVLVSYLLRRVVEVLTKKPQGFLSTLFLTGIAAFCTGAAWYSGQLMADIFTAFLFLCTFLYLFQKDGSKVRTVFIFGLLGFSILTHNSNIVTMAGAVIALLLYGWLKDREVFKKGLHLGGLIVFCTLLTCTLNLTKGWGFTLSPSSHVFLMGRLVESGVMDEFLKHECQHTDYKLCAYKDQLPNRAWDFVWNADGPLYKTGGWDDNKEEFGSIFKQILTSPRYLSLAISTNAEGTLRQMTEVNVGDGLFPYNNQSNVFYNIQAYYPHSLKAFFSSRQQQKSLNIKDWNTWLILVFMLSSLAVLYTMSRNEKVPTVWVSAYLLLFLFLLGNAAVSASFANVLGRLQSRVFWILPFLNLVWLFYYCWPIDKQIGASENTPSPNAPE